MIEINFLRLSFHWSFFLEPSLWFKHWRIQNIFQYLYAFRNDQMIPTSASIKSPHLLDIGLTSYQALKLWCRVRSYVLWDRHKKTAQQPTSDSGNFSDKWQIRSLTWNKKNTYRVSHKTLPTRVCAISQLSIELQGKCWAFLKSPQNSVSKNV